LFLTNKYPYLNCPSQTHIDRLGLEYPVSLLVGYVVLLSQIASRIDPGLSAWRR